MRAFDSRPYKAYFIVLLIILTAGVYSSTLSGGFVYDDNSQILENRWIRDFSNIPEVLTSSGTSFQNKSANTYRPMLHLVFMAEYHLFGLNPLWYHLVNILLHTANAMLFYILASFLFSCERAARPSIKGRAQVLPFPAPVTVLDCLPPFLGALLFALNPVNTEVVSWLSAVPELAFTLFLFLSFYLYAASKGRTALYAFSLISFFLALLSKETALSLLFLIAAYDFAGEGWSFIKGWKRYLPFTLVAFGYMALRTYAVGGIIHHKQANLGAFEAFINIFPLIFEYIGKLFLPINLNALYEFHPAQGISDYRVILGFAAVLIFAALMYIFREVKIIFLGLVSIMVPLLPVLYVPALSSAAFADRYLYLPSAGYALLLAFAVKSIIPRPPRKLNIPGLLVLGLAVTAVLLYSFGSVKRSMVWRDDYTLWKDTVSKSPNNANAHYNFAWASHGKGDLRGAEINYREAIRLDPGSADAHYNLGLVYTGESLFPEALAEFREALRIDPGYSEARERISALEGLSNGAH